MKVDKETINRVEKDYWNNVAIRRHLRLNKHLGLRWIIKFSIYIWRIRLR